MCGQGTDGKSLYLSLNFAVNSKTALKEKDNINNKVFKKKGKRKKKEGKKLNFSMSSDLICI